MATVSIYGIKACDTMKKAFDWLGAQDIGYAFHDYKKTPLDAATLDDWCRRVGWEVLLNKRGTSWRKLSAADQADVDEAKAKRLMLANNSLIKRPVVVHGKQVLVGFDAERWGEHFA